MEAYVHSQYRVGYGLGSVQQAGETRPMDSLAVLSNVAAAAQAGGNIPPADTRYQDPTAYAHNNSHGSSPMAEALGVMKSHNMDPDPVSPPRGHQTPSVIKIEKPDCEMPLPSVNNGATESFVSEMSDLSSRQSSFSSKATTPADNDTPRKRMPDLSTPSITCRSFSHDGDRLDFIVQPKSSIPKDVPPSQYATECIIAAENSRLNPYALHTEEHLLLRHHITYAQVTTYLNVRNSILRLWLKKPWQGITREEAVGCANARWFDAANLCYDWLARRGYINFGCLDLGRVARKTKLQKQISKRRTIAVVGAGISGLSCARQLEGLFKQYADRFNDLGEDVPKVLLIEGRGRVGGRVYSRQFKTQPRSPMDGFHTKRCTAEMGGMIITGFDRGNPINILVRGQLCLPYHALKAETTIYDSDGKPVDAERDQLIEKLYNDCLDRVSEHKHKMTAAKLIQGNRDLLDEGKDSPTDGSKSIAQSEEMAISQTNESTLPQQHSGDTVPMIPVSSDKLTGRVYSEPGVPATSKASEKVAEMGWNLKHGIDKETDLDLSHAVHDPDCTLGSVLDDAISQYKSLVELNPLDHRLINWHIANLEYSNATNLHNLSLRLWDIDAGNEWEGSHTMIVGGYQSVARGLLHCPTPLDITSKSPVKRISYHADSFVGPASIECEDGKVVEADSVVCTVPLGVLKHGNIEFDPPVPDWKSQAIERLGFGILNKVVLVYDRVFWEADRHIFGVLKDAPDPESTSQHEYRGSRGRFFQWFNVTNTTGMPCLLALMAGDAGFDTETTSNEALIREATETLRSVFGPDVPHPLEAVVTRWGSDPFARGSYSSAAPDMQPEDYDNMAKPLGNLFFAGEHTIGTHPATVHGAYLSGLRAASEILAEILGPIEVPTPLILPRDSLLLQKRKEAAKDPRQARIDAYEAEAWKYVQSKIGERPVQPGKVAGNAYLLFSKMHFDEARKRCEENRKGGRTKAMPNEVRVMTSRMWKEASEETRRPFEMQANEQKQAYAEAMAKYAPMVEKWDLEAIQIRTAYERSNPFRPEPGDAMVDSRGRILLTPKSRRARNVSYAEDNDGSMEF
ncbi:lysine-specific histone demethylase 1 [Akanthomyces lecanii RCEF 1005]|uniref:Lysine-specific histone demethylase 1 n=1 Tax=Akanthomyces lecanii RCEF 1005 TaxID=1081108 RepID=A0A162K7J3_CORDF|nr:lysine-specific histone demethylase 1 [Akanthomyces lecanii RCEF 1005]